MIDAPSYTLNHEEVAKALEEGVRFAESVTPDEVEVDQYGHAAALWVWVKTLRVSACVCRRVQFW